MHTLAYTNLAVDLRVLLYHHIEAQQQVAVSDPYSYGVKASTLAVSGSARRGGWFDRVH
jgi:hypothetical protein